MCLRGEEEEFWANSSMFPILCGGRGLTCRMSRMRFRDMARAGDLPGVQKASW